MGDLDPTRLESGESGEPPFCAIRVAPVVDAAKDMSDSAKIELPYCSETLAKCIIEDVAESTSFDLADMVMRSVVVGDRDNLAGGFLYQPFPVQVVLRERSRKFLVEFSPDEHTKNIYFS